MTGRPPWRSLQSVMIVTLHVAVVAYAVRVLTGPSSSMGSIWIGVPLTIALAVFLSWPIGRAIAMAFDPGDASADRRCPRCGRRELRPLLRSSRGLFQPVTGYRCAGCWSTFRQVGGEKFEEPAPRRELVVDPSGIDFLDQGASEGEVRFLDDDEEADRLA